MFTRKKSKKGFTMVELIVVIAIIAIISAVAIPTTIVYVGKSRISTAATEVGNISSGTIEPLMATYNGNATVTDLQNAINETLDVSTVKYVTSITFAYDNTTNKVTVTIRTEQESDGEDVTTVPEETVVGMQKTYPAGNMRFAAETQSVTLTIAEGAWGTAGN